MHHRKPLTTKPPRCWTNKKKSFNIKLHTFFLQLPLFLLFSLDQPLHTVCSLFSTTSHLIKLNYFFTLSNHWARLRRETLHKIISSLFTRETLLLLLCFSADDCTLFQLVCQTLGGGFKGQEFTVLRCNSIRCSSSMLYRRCGFTSLNSMVARARWSLLDCNNQLHKVACTDTHTQTLWTVYCSFTRPHNDSCIIGLWYPQLWMEALIFFAITPNLSLYCFNFYYHWQLAVDWRFSTVWVRDCLRISSHM